MNILFIEPFYSGSHKVFLDGLQQHSRHEIYPLTMTSDWRLWSGNGGAIAMANRIATLDAEFDLILTSNYANLAGIRALLGAKFAHIPAVIYMHENAFTESELTGRELDIQGCYQSFINLLSADTIVFSSHHHRQSLFDRLPTFLPQFPDMHLSESLERLKEKSLVIHPGLDLRRHDQVSFPKIETSKPVILWNQRWTYEKDPAKFFRMMNRLDDAGFEFELILAGDNRGDKPEEFEKAWRRYGKRIRHIGYVDDFQSYSRFLHQADFVVSTARHEYFSVSVMEAIHCGCHPFLPHNLTYPELIPNHLRYPLLHAQVFYKDEDELFKNMREALRGDEKPLPKESLRTISEKFDWSRKIAEFDNLFDGIGS